ncbi:MAG: hypothetical protein J2P54_14805, partial [Bradyrhizobiaceae bacterium]|nr:hypothetical protein [Bradyrhizobiaceae bacterium]
NIFFRWPYRLLPAAVAAFTWRSLERGAKVPPFVAAIGLFLLGYLALRSQPIRISCRLYSRSRKPPLRLRAKCSC